MNYPVHRTPEEGHTKACLAKAMIEAIENLRDSEGITDVAYNRDNPATTDYEFRLAVQEGTPLEWADYYLTEGLTECICPPVTVGEHLERLGVEVDYRA